MKERANPTTPDVSVESLVRHVGQMIETAQREVAVAANVSLTTLYWQVGKHVRTEALEGRRAEYGGQIVAALGLELQTRYGRSSGEKSLRHMIRFAEVFPDSAIVSALRRQLSWTHLKQLIYVADRLKRDFYVEMCRIEGWSTRILTQKMRGLLYERTDLKIPKIQSTPAGQSGDRHSADSSPPKKVRAFRREKCIHCIHGANLKTNRGGGPGAAGRRRR